MLLQGSADEIIPSLKPPGDVHGFAEEYAVSRRKSGAGNALIRVSRNNREGLLKENDRRRHNEYG